MNFVFDLFDSNRTGTLTSHEVRLLLQTTASSLSPLSKDVRSDATAAPSAGVALTLTHIAGTRVTQGEGIHKVEGSLQVSLLGAGTTTLSFVTSLQHAARIVEY